MLRITITTLVLLTSCVAQRVLGAAEEPLTTLPTPTRGTLILCGTAQPTDDVLESFLHMSGRDQARIAVIDDGEATTAASIRYLQDQGASSVRRIVVASREAANESGNLGPILNATGVWISGADPAFMAEILRGTALGDRVGGMLEAGRVVGGRAAGAEVLGHRWISKNDDGAIELREGLGVFPHAIVDPALTEKSEATLAGALELAPGTVGYGLPETSAIAMRHRIARVIGEPVSVFFAPSKNRPLRRDVVERSFDIVAMARAGIARAAPAFPAESPPIPHVANGSLVIVGGGQPKEIVGRFIELAGGPEEARIVVIPTAIGPHLAKRPGKARFLRNLGVENIDVVHAATRDEADRPEVLGPLRNATGIWFTGGRQWRLVDSYAGTEAERLMHEVLARGGVIGGSSAGATIQADYLVRGHPLGNQEMMAEGYERGFGFLQGVAIDQHFAQRNRFADMSNLKHVFPQLIGLGIDEKTAAIVQKNTLTVIGEGQIAIYDRKDAATPGPEYKSLSAGQSYDFESRRVVNETKD